VHALRCERQLVKRSDPGLRTRAVEPKSYPDMLSWREEVSQKINCRVASIVQMNFHSKKRDTAFVPLFVLYG
jgi:hypothetical protein